MTLLKTTKGSTFVAGSKGLQTSATGHRVTSVAMAMARSLRTRARMTYLCVLVVG